LATVFFYFQHELGRGMMLPGGMALNSIQFEMESWTGAQRAFTVKSFYKNNDSYFAAQREFRKKFGIHRNSKVLSTRWGYKSHCKNCNEHFAPTFSWTSHFQIWRHRMASKISRLISV
jgi:hypothetical protein